MKLNKVIKYFTGISIIILVAVNVLECNGQEAIISSHTRFDHLALGGVSYHPSQVSGQVMFGMMKNSGGFIKLKSNFHISLDGDGDIWGESNEDIMFTDKEEKCRLGITIGFLHKIFDPFIFYGGLGYGVRWENWETLDYGNSYRVTDRSFNGIQADLGFILSIKKILISAGVCPIFNLDYQLGSESYFDYVEVDFGVGYRF